MASYVNFYSALLLACIIAQVEVRSYQEDDRVTQGLRDVTSPDAYSGKDYRYSGEVIQPNKRKNKQRRTTLEELDVDFFEFNSKEVKNGNADFPTDEEQTETAIEKPPTDRPTRQTDDPLEAYRDRLVELLNDYRAELGLTQFQVDGNLERGAQKWAIAESNAFKISHSCEECVDYSEVLAKRRSSRPLSQGVDIADWTYKTLFAEDVDRTYASITDDKNVHTVGFGIAFRRHPTDGTYQAYMVLRFARG